MSKLEIELIIMVAYIKLAFGHCRTMGKPNRHVPFLLGFEMNGPSVLFVFTDVGFRPVAQ